MRRKRRLTKVEQRAYRACRAIRLKCRPTQLEHIEHAIFEPSDEGTHFFYLGDFGEPWRGFPYHRHDSGISERERALLIRLDNGMNKRNTFNA